RAGRYWFTEHAVLQMARRGIRRRDVEEAVLNGRIIEDYPEDKYSPSCLICGTAGGEPLHVHLSLPPDVWVVTTYHPDPDKRLDPFTRRPRI
ncbi:MAG: DUF4258 domain-containing protein, partial [Nitrospirota bacterium]